MKRYMLIMPMIIAILFCCAVHGQPNQQTNPQNTVIISGFSFLPPLLNVPPGTNVTWINQDNVGHTVTSDNNAFDSGTIAPGKSYTHRFNSPGTYAYHCRIHPTMQGSIAVSSLQASAIKSIMTGMVIPGSANQGGSQEQSGAESNTQSSGAWSETPISGQNSLLGGTQQIAAFQMNFNGTMSRSLGQIISPGLTQNLSPVLQYSQYYKIMPQTPSKPLTSPTKYELSQEPAMLYFGGSGSQKAITYSQYQSYATYTGQNSLWIQGPASWTQYAAVPQGASLSLLAVSPSGGYGYLYEIYPDGTLDKQGYYFYPYDQISFYADQEGQHLLMYVIEGQPSNIVVIDVVSYQPQPPIYNYAKITVSSGWLRGYNVYVDNNYQATEGTTGEAPGVVSIVVPGDRYHTISVQGSGFYFSDYRYFNAGWAYTLTI